MHIYRLFPVFILITMCSLLSACLGESLPLTEEEKQNLALLNAVNSDKQGIKHLCIRFIQSLYN